MVHEVPDQERFFADIKRCLNKKGHFFVAEPRFHVSKKRFNKMIATAENNGLKLHNRPKVRFSMAALFENETDL